MEPFPCVRFSRSRQLCLCLSAGCRGVQAVFLAEEHRAAENIAHNCERCLSCLSHIVCFRLGKCFRRRAWRRCRLCRRERYEESVGKRRDGMHPARLVSRVASFCQRKIFRMVCQDRGEYAFMCVSGCGARTGRGDGCNASG